MDKLPRIRKQARQIAKSDKTKATKSAAKKIVQETEHELGEIRRGEWVKKKKKKASK